ncbi:MAG TPA: hypothetical protein VMR74_05185 [Gammaproteobacteria bacterium]|nr:hypothetical protein [Gammaproteobacteria bacterium]
MVVLRATQKVLKTLPESASDADVSDTALGDWYVNRITLDRQPLLLLVSSNSLLAMLAPARNVKTLPSRISGMVAARLERLGVEGHLIRAEVQAMNVALVGRTRDRSVIGQMVDFAKAIPYYVPIGTGRDEARLRVVEDQLAHTPCRCGRSDAETIWPDRDSALLLAERWSKQKTVH